jgi:hypothetical protein
MNLSAHQKLLRAQRIELLRLIRLWLGVAGVFALGLAGIALTNSVSNPETWSSAFRALAAAGILLPYAGWVAGIGVLLLLLCGVLSVYLRRADGEL